MRTAKAHPYMVKMPMRQLMETIRRRWNVPGYKGVKVSKIIYGPNFDIDVVIASLALIYDLHPVARQVIESIKAVRVATPTVEMHANAELPDAEVVPPNAPYSSAAAAGTSSTTAPTLAKEIYGIAKLYTDDEPVETEESRGGQSSTRGQGDPADDTVYGPPPASGSAAPATSAGVQVERGRGDLRQAKSLVQRDKSTRRGDSDDAPALVQGDGASVGARPPSVHADGVAGGQEPGSSGYDGTEADDKECARRVDDGDAAGVGRDFPSDAQGGTADGGHSLAVATSVHTPASRAARARRAARLAATQLVAKDTAATAEAKAKKNAEAAAAASTKKAAIAAAKGRAAGNGGRKRRKLDICLTSGEVKAARLFGAPAVVKLEGITGGRWDNGGGLTAIAAAAARQTPEMKQARSTHGTPPTPADGRPPAAADPAGVDTSCGDRCDGGDPARGRPAVSEGLGGVDATARVGQDDVAPAARDGSGEAGKKGPAEQRGDGQGAAAETGGQSDDRGGPDDKTHAAASGVCVANRQAMQLDSDSASDDGDDQRGDGSSTASRRPRPAPSAGPRRCPTWVARPSRR